MPRQNRCVMNIDVCRSARGRNRHVLLRHQLDVALRRVRTSSVVWDSDHVAHPGEQAALPHGFTRVDEGCDRQPGQGAADAVPLGAGLA